MGECACGKQLLFHLGRRKKLREILCLCWSSRKLEFEHCSFCCFTGFLMQKRIWNKKERFDWSLGLRVVNSLAMKATLWFVCPWP